MAREVDHLALHAAHLGDVLEHQDAAGGAPLAVLDRGDGVADGELPAVAPHQHGVARVLDDPPLGEAALDGVGQRLAVALVDDVEDARHRQPAGLAEVPPRQPLGDRVEIVDDAGGVGAHDAVADRGEGHLRQLLLLGERVLGELALDLGGGAGGEDLEDRQRRHVLADRRGAHHRDVPERPFGAVEQRHGDVALDPGRHQPAVLGEELPDAGRVEGDLAADHLLAGSAAEVVLERRAVVVDLPQGEHADPGDRLVANLGDGGVLHAEGAGEMADERAQEIGADGRGGPLDDGAQPLLPQLAVGDVDGGGERDRLAVVDRDVGRRHVEPALPPVLGEDAHLVTVGDRLAAQAGGGALAEELLELRGGHVPGLHREQLLGAVAGQLRAGGIDVEDAVGPVDEDGRGGGLRQDAEPAVVLVDRKLRLAGQNLPHRLHLAFSTSGNLQWNHPPGPPEMKVWLRIRAF